MGQYPTSSEPIAKLPEMDIHQAMELARDLAEKQREQMGFNQVAARLRMMF